MAGVKTKRAGAARPTRFTPVDCHTCGQQVAKLPEAYRLLAIRFEGAKSARNYTWQHRRCASTGGK